MNNSMIISIEGNIGSGKSTLVKLLNEKFNSPQIHFLSEPVDEWSNFMDENGENILTKFYKNQEKYSFTFQIMAYISRLNKLKHKMEELKMINQNSIIITERSLSTDKHVFAQMLYDDNKMEKIQLDIYNEWFHSFNKETTVKKIIYIQTQPEICSKRINKRSRSGEENIPLDYLQNCHNYHENMMDIERKDGKEILILDGNDNIYDNNILNNWIIQISKFIDLNPKGIINNNYIFK